MIVDDVSVPMCEFVMVESDRVARVWVKVRNARMFIIFRHNIVPLHGQLRQCKRECVCDCCAMAEPCCAKCACICENAIRNGDIKLFMILYYENVWIIISCSVVGTQSSIVIIYTRMNISIFYLNFISFCILFFYLCEYIGCRSIVALVCAFHFVVVQSTHFLRVFARF